MPDRPPASRNTTRRMRRWLPPTLAAAAALAFAVMLLARLSHPLLWQDEAETVMFATHVVEYGYPKVHGERNVVYEFGPDVAVGVKERFDAYIGKTWADFYFAVPGLLWSRTVKDVYARTARLRLPFALAGAAGVGLLLWAVWPAVPGGRGRAWLFAALYLALCALSISLLLHLREVRYYALLQCTLAGILGVQLRHAVFRSARPGRTVAVQALLLFALFQVFFAAWFAVATILSLEALWRAWRAGPDPAVRRREAVPTLAAVGLSALAVAPFLVFFETFSVASRFARHLDVGAGGYAENVWFALRHLARHELLVPVVLTRLAVHFAAETPATRPARRTSAFLTAFGVGYAAFALVNPLVYERYFVPLGPLLVAVFLLDAFVLVQAGGGRIAAAALAALALASLAVRSGEIGGRLAEIAEPVRGPLDVAVPWLLERYPDPESLVIATNYEAHPLMVYLGCRVIVGLSLNDIVRERALEPDVVIPRLGWPRSLVEIRRFLARGHYRMVELPVLDLHYNNVPSLSTSASTPSAHRFHSALPVEGDPAPRLRIYVRVEAEGSRSRDASR